MVSAASLIESIGSRLSLLKRTDLAVFWFQVSTEREKFKSDLIECRKKMTVVPLIVRDDGFNAPNAILSDLSKLITANRDEFSTPCTTSPTVIVILSKTTLEVPQLSSPITLPSWVPNCGGLTVNAVIEDLSYTADTLFNPAVIQMDGIYEQLWRLERVFTDRLERENLRDHRQTNALLNYFRASDPTITIQSMVDKSRRYRIQFSEPSAFRPSVRDSACLVSRFVAIVSQSSPDELSKRCKWISDALGCPEAGKYPPEALIAVLLRPTNRISDPKVRLARNIVLSVYCAYQLANTSAHAGEYGRYPILLLRGISYDLRNVLSKAADFLDIS